LGSVPYNFKSADIVLGAINDLDPKVEKIIIQLKDNYFRRHEYS
jgi:hypothetical protein